MSEWIIQLLAERYNLNEETVNSIIRDIFSWVHEISYKKGYQKL